MSMGLNLFTSFLLVFETGRLVLREGANGETVDCLGQAGYSIAVATETGPPSRFGMLETNGSFF